MKKKIMLVMQREKLKEENVRERIKTRLMALYTADVQSLSEQICLEGSSESIKTGSSLERLM